MHRLAPELDEYDPELSRLRGEPEARGEKRGQTPPRIAPAARLGGGHAPVEVGRHGLERRDEDCPLVAEVVVEDPLAHAGLARHLLHGEARVAVAGEATDRGTHDLLTSKRADTDLGAHPFY